MIVNMDIRCHEGVGPIRFGMSPNEVRAALGVDFSSFKRSSKSIHPCDHFSELECFVYYDSADGVVDAVEFAAPAKPTLDGVMLLGMSFTDLLEKIGQADPDVAIESDGFTSLRLGIGGWAPAAEDRPDDPVESVIVFARGYYG